MSDTTPFLKLLTGSFSTPGLDLAMDTLVSRLVVCDVIMNPAETNLLRTAAAQGATVLDGRGMLVNQAVLNIWNWTGVRVDTAVLRSTLDAIL